MFWFMYSFFNHRPRKKYFLHHSKRNITLSNFYYFPSFYKKKPSNINVSSKWKLYYLQNTFLQNFKGVVWKFIYYPKKPSFKFNYDSIKFGSFFCMYDKKIIFWKLSSDILYTYVILTNVAVFPTVHGRDVFSKYFSQKYSI